MARRLLTISTYKQNATKQRADIKCYDLPLTLHAGTYPIFAVRMQDARDLGATARNINVDVVGKSESGKDYKALGGGNNKWTKDYKLSDGSHVFMYDLTKVNFGTGGQAPTTEAMTFTTFQIKYADIAITSQVDYNLYWVQTFTSQEELEKYIANVDGLTY